MAATKHEKETPAECKGVEGLPCGREAVYENAYGVQFCAYHKLVVDAFTWESRARRQWRLIEKVR